ncbi:MAG: hypothetical protein R3B59_09725 [Dehalococcoidia bacterium]
MNRLAPSLLAALTVLVLLAAACSGDDEGETTPTATATPTTVETATRTATAAATATAPATVTSTPAASATATAPPSEFTGLPAVDAVIAAVLSKDLDRVAALAQLRSVACGPQAGIGSPPPCPAGQPDGTPVPVFPVATCEGEWRPESALRPSIQPLLNDPQLYAVYGMPSQFQPLMPDGQYVAVFSRSAAGQGRVGVGVVIGAQAVVGIWYGCGATPDQIVPAGTSTILAPRP